MKNTNRKQSNLLEGLLGDINREKASGLAFSAAVFLPYVLAFVFAVVGGIFGLFYEGAEKENWYIYVSYLLSQIAFFLVAVFYFRTSKTPLKSVIGKPSLWDFVLAIILQFGLLSLSGVNSWFVIWLQKLGLQVQPPQVPSMDGWGFVGVLFVIAVLPAVFEELVFRGILLQGLKGFPTWAAALICGGLFSLFHQNPAQTLYQFFCGVAFALLVLRSGSILPTMVAHFCNNAFVLCTEKFAWQTDMLPILIASAVCFLVAVGYLVLFVIKSVRERAEGEGNTEKADWKGFLLCVSAGVFLCVMGWVSGLFRV